MELGFTFIASRAEKVEQVICELRNIPDVTELYSLFGKYELLAKLESGSRDALEGAVNEIRLIEHVVATYTFLTNSEATAKLACSADSLDSYFPR